MGSNPSPQDVVALVRERGLVRPRDLQPLGVSREQLRRLVARGVLEQPGRGLYRLASADIDQHASLAEVAARVPDGVICLLSALAFHHLTTQSPHDVWIAVDHKAWAPRSLPVQVRLVRASGAALTEGIEEHLVEGVPVRIYTPAKTVADCFKYRSTVGLDLAIEALREVWLERRATMDEIIHYARICRVANVMRPYLESIVA